MNSGKGQLSVDDEIQTIKAQAKKEMEEMENKATPRSMPTEKVVQPTNSKFTQIIYYLSEIVVYWYIGFFINVMIVKYVSYEYAISYQSITGIFGLISIPLLIIASIMYIFVLDTQRRKIGYVLRTATIILYTVLFVSSNSYLSNAPNGRGYIILGIFILYALYSQFILKTYMLVKDKPFKMLFKKSVAGSPAELEWRKYDTSSGIIAFVLGFFLLQPIWLIYHFIIRPKVIENTKKKLIVSSLEFGKEVNLSTIALDLGVPLEEVIFYLKQLNLKRHVIVEFTRYGAILLEIRRAKYLTPIVEEKYQQYLNERKRTELEKHIEKLFMLAERGSVRERDFRKVMGLKPEVSLKDFELLFPANCIRIKTNFMNKKKKTVILNRDNLLMKREKIIEMLVQEGEKIFELKKK